jgi:phenylacetate-coenzyme A ligase PaaK-like adenylate-forming protein
MKELSIHHYDNCKEYKKIIDTLNINLKNITKVSDIPFVPVGLFKEFELKSVKQEDVFKIMTSSGTTGQAVSKIVLDKQNALNQQKVIVKIIVDFIEKPRMPMIIIDSPSVIKDRKMFSARGAGILGFSIFGLDRIYALNDDMSINIKLIEEFLEKNKDQNIFLFGFTFIVWEYFYKILKNTGTKIDLSKAILIHGGGWKKLANEAVSPMEFNKSLENICNLKNIHDYYGMVEQTGCIYVECEYGHLHCSVFSDIIIRRSKDFSVAEINEKGVIQVISLLPTSYPGHSILTEDEGVILGEDDCLCKRKGKYFKIFGRIKNAELRGCSDTFERH